MRRRGRRTPPPPAGSAPPPAGLELAGKKPLRSDFGNYSRMPRQDESPESRRLFSLTPPRNLSCYCFPLFKERDSREIKTSRFSFENFLF